MRASAGWFGAKQARNKNAFHAKILAGYPLSMYSNL